MNYPDWSDFQIGETCYGVGAPIVGCGVYTIDRKFSWPDRECTSKKEYIAWEQHLTENSYEIPEKYKDAYVKE